MIYVMSDLHGCYDEYKEMLDKINFHQDDMLYIVGDILDRGEKPISILEDMMMYDNIIPILGNHDYMAYYILKHLNTQITKDNVETHLNEEFMQLYLDWLQDGGSTTLKQFKKISSNKKEIILEYLQEFSLYEELEVNQQKYVLVHAGIEHFQENKPLSHYDLADLLFKRTNYNQIYFHDKYLITGHTPTMIIRDDHQPLIYKDNRHIAIDCGCVYGKKLACYCLNTQEEFYIDKKTSRK